MLTHIVDCVILYKTLLWGVKMELLQLTYFCSAAETQNFSKTAKRYTVPTSNISQSIHRLEDELGALMFDRSANKITLNEQGKLFYKKIKTAIMLIEEAKSSLNGCDEISGEIRIQAMSNRHIVTEAIENFPNQSSKISFMINHSSDDDTDNYDLIITDKIMPQKYLKKELLVVDKILLAISKDNPLASKKNLCVKDLENERFISMGNERGIFELTNEICASFGFVPNIVIKSDDPFYIRKYVEMGLGICFFPSLSWKGMFADSVKIRQIIDIKRNTYVYTNTQKFMSPATKLFYETLLKTASKYADK